MKTAVEEGRGGPAARLAGRSWGPCGRNRMCCRRGSQGLPAGPRSREADGNKDVLGTPSGVCHSQVCKRTD